MPGQAFVSLRATSAGRSVHETPGVAENNYRSLTDKCREEFRVRQQVIEGMKSERSLLMSLAVIAGAIGARAAGLTTQAARWLWDTFRGILSSGRATLAMWWNA